MKANIGMWDKVIRILLAVIIASLGIYYNSWWGILAVVPFFTAIVSWCPLYSIFGISTCAVKKRV